MKLGFTKSPWYKFLTRPYVKLEPPPNYNVNDIGFKFSFLSKYVPRDRAQVENNQFLFSAPAVSQLEPSPNYNANDIGFIFSFLSKYVPRDKALLEIPQGENNQFLSTAPAVSQLEPSPNYNANDIGLKFSFLSKYVPRDKAFFEIPQGENSQFLSTAPAVSQAVIKKSMIALDQNQPETPVSKYAPALPNNNIMGNIQPKKYKFGLIFSTNSETLYFNNQKRELGNFGILTQLMKKMPQPFLISIDQYFINMMEEASKTVGKTDYFLTIHKNFTKDIIRKSMYPTKLFSPIIEKNDPLIFYRNRFGETFNLVIGLISIINFVVGILTPQRISGKRNYAKPREVFLYKKKKMQDNLADNNNISSEERINNYFNRLMFDIFGNTTVQTGPKLDIITQTIRKEYKVNTDKLVATDDISIIYESDDLLPLIWVEIMRYLNNDIYAHICNECGGVIASKKPRKKNLCPDCQTEYDKEYQQKWRDNNKSQDKPTPPAPSDN